MHIVDAGAGRPEFMEAQVGEWVGGLFAGIGMRP